jgi:hypothetical protein
MPKQFSTKMPMVPKLLIILEEQTEIVSEPKKVVLQGSLHIYGDINLQEFILRAHTRVVFKGRRLC